MLTACAIGIAVIMWPLLRPLMTGLIGVIRVICMLLLVVLLSECALDVVHQDTSCGRVDHAVSQG